MWGKRLKRWKTMPISARLAQTSLSFSSWSRLPTWRYPDELAVDGQLATVDLLQVVDAPQERALPRTGRAR